MLSSMYIYLYLYIYNCVVETISLNGDHNHKQTRLASKIFDIYDIVNIGLICVIPQLHHLESIRC
jgi:hypothetical protein